MLDNPQLLLWAEAVRGAPNDFVRSALFTARNRKIPRQNLKQALLATVGEGEITGHSPEHAALYCAERKLLLSGDMVLPRISTNVSVFELEQEANPLEWFLRSIAKYYNCDADTLVFPSHGKPFKNLHVRIKQLEDHHKDRLAEVIEACRDKECCAMDIVPIMFKRPLDLHQTTFAMGEALAHLHALWFRGELKRVVDLGGAVCVSLACVCLLVHRDGQIPTK